MTTKVWKARIPSILWNDLVKSGLLLELVHKEIERGMWKRGYVKVPRGRRWVWLSREEIAEVMGDHAHQVTK